MAHSTIRYTGPVTAESPAWMRETYIIHTRDTLALLKSMIANREFDGKWHYSPFEETNASGKRVWSDLMSGHWAWKQAVRVILPPY